MSSAGVYSCPPNLWHSPFTPFMLNTFWTWHCIVFLEIKTKNSGFQTSISLLSVLQLQRDLKCTSALQRSPHCWEGFTYIQYKLYFGLTDLPAWRLQNRAIPQIPPAESSHKLYRKKPKKHNVELWLEACLSWHVTAWSLSASLTVFLYALAAALLGHQQRAPPGPLEAVGDPAESWHFVTLHDALSGAGGLRLSWKALDGAAQLRPAENWTFLKCVSTVFSTCGPCAVMCFLWGWTRQRKKKMTYIRSLTWLFGHFNAKEGPVKSLLGNTSLLCILWVFPVSAFL